MDAVDPMSIREYMNRRWRWLPLVLVLSIGAAALIAHFTTQATHFGRVITTLPLLALPPYLAWAFRVSCPRCGYDFFKSDGAFYYYAWTGEMAECAKCGLSIDEPINTPPSQAGSN
jgi:hypothetical protein